MIAATAVLSAVRANWKMAAGVGAIVALIVLVALLRGEKRHSAKLSTRIVELTELRKADRAAYINAQAAAAALNKVQVARIEVEQEKISAQQKSDFARDLGRVRAGGVRQDLAAAPSPTRRAQAGGVPAPTCRDDSENLCVARSRVLQGAESELAKNALIDWINMQLAVER